MIEAELKADVRDPDRVATLLLQRSKEELRTYHDVYYEKPDRTLGSEGRELRIRTIVGDGSQRHILTYKEAAVDLESGSKPEYETQVDDSEVVARALLGTGLVVDISYEKQCRNFRFSDSGREFLATLVTIPEIGSGTFLEIETMVSTEADLASALEAIRAILTSLGIDVATELNARYYQDMVAEHRARTSE